MRSRIALPVAALIALAIPGCASSDPRQAAAERFIDELYIKIDQPAARQLAVGLAAAKIDEEIRLKDGQAIDETTRQPSVHYGFVRTDGGEGDTAALVYDLHIAPDGADAFTRRLVLSLRREDGSWKIANYTLDNPPVPGE